jgi:hypothetical protein
MFEAGNQMGIFFKTLDKIGLIGKLRQNDFDGDFAPDSGFKSAIDNSEAACSDALV